MRNQCNYCVWLCSSKNGLQAAVLKATTAPDICELLLTRLSQSKQPVSQQELNSCHSLESPSLPPCLTRPFTVSSNTLMHSNYSWGKEGEIMVALNVYEQRKEKVEGCSDSDRHTEKVWEDQWRCQGDGWGRSSSARQSLERKSLKGECTETRLINNDPGMLKLLCWLYMNKKKKHVDV